MRGLIGTMRFQLAVFCLSASLLFLVSLLIRASSVAFGIDFLFFILPLSFFGIGIGGFVAYVWSAPISMLSRAALVYVAAVIVLFLIAGSAGRIGFPATVVFLGLSALANGCIGFILARLFREFGKKAARFYALDLLGAAIGIVLAAVSLTFASYEISVVLAIVVASLPAFLLTSRPKFPLYALGAMLLVVLASIPWAGDVFSIQCTSKPPSLARKTNFFSQADVVASSLDRQQELGTWRDGSAVHANGFLLTVDCNGFVTPIVASAKGDEVFLERSLRSIPFAYAREKLGPQYSVLVPSAGGGIDIVRARLFSRGPIDATEFNRNVLDLTKRFSDPSLYPYEQPGVRLTIGDSRRFIEMSSSTYDVIMLARAGVYGSITAETRAPSYSITLEAFIRYVEHLSPDGVIVHARPADQSFTHLYTALSKSGIDPYGRMVLLYAKGAGEDMVLAQKKPFSSTERDAIVRLADERGFETRFLERGGEEGVSYASLTDNYPYVMSSAVAHITKTTLLILFISTCIAAVCAIAILRRKTSGPYLKHGFLALYIACIGCGFTFLELGFVQKILFIIAEPGLAVASTLMAFLAFGALGAWFAGSLPRERFITWITAATILLATYLGVAAQFDSLLMHFAITLDVALRLLIGCAALSIPAFFTGMYFPFALAVASDEDVRLIAWVWAIDGVFGVIGGLVAKSLFQLMGLSSLYGIAAAIYIIACACFIAHRRSV